MFRTGLVLAIVATALVMAAVSVTITAHEPSNQLSAAVHRCLDSHDPMSDECTDALALSGMAAADFWPTLAFKLYDGAAFCEDAHADNHPDTETPKEDCWPPVVDAPPVQSDTITTLDGMVKDCLAKYRLAAARRGPSAMANAAAESCARAIRESGLSPRDFFSKYGAPR